MESILTIQLADQSGTMKTLSDFQHKRVLLFVYPKDNTPGCTIENRDFSHYRSQFLALDIEPVGISADSSESHSKFCNNHGLQNSLLSDPEMKIIQTLGAYGEKTMYGKSIGKGIIRSTYLINTKTGAIEKEWKNVRALGHAKRLLQELQHTIA